MNSLLLLVTLGYNAGDAVVRCQYPGVAFSGVVISQELVLTAKHCGNGRYGQQIEVRFPNGKDITGVWYAQCEAYDGPALIKIPKGDWPIAHISSRGPTADKEKIWALGYPGATYTLNHITGTVRRGSPIGNAQMTQFNRGQIPGYSGGPLFTSKGEIVGLASHVNLHYGVTWHITHRDIARFCHAHGVSPSRKTKVPEPSI